MVIANDVTVINQYAYVNHYFASQAEVLEAVMRELRENPAKPRLTWISFDKDGKAQAHFTLTDHGKAQAKFKAALYPNG